MNMKKLLATTAVAAMMATSASATITAVLGDVNATVGDSTNALATIANELNMNSVGTAGGAELAGVFDVLVTTSNPMPSGSNLVTITLPNGILFNGIVPITANGVGADVGGLPASILFGDGAGSATDNFTVGFISSGGADKSSTVTVGFTSPTPSTQTQLKLRLSVKVGEAACTADKLSINLTTAAGVAIEGGTASSSTNFVQCKDAISLKTAKDAVATTMALPSFLGFLAQAASGAGTDADSATVANLGTIAPGFAGPLAIDPTVDGSLAKGATNDPILPADIAKIDFSVTMGNAAGLATVNVEAGNTGTVFAGTPNSGNANQFDFSVTGATAVTIANLIDATADNINATVSGANTTAVAVQSATLSDVVVTFAAGTQFTSATRTFAGVALDGIKHEGTSFGPYDWVGDGASTSRNIFTFTGLTNGSLAATATFSNSKNGAAFNKDVNFNLNVVNGGSQVFSKDAGSSGNLTLEAMNPGFGRADVTFTFFSNQPGSDIDRLILRSGVLTAFGNTNNVGD